MGQRGRVRSGGEESDKQSLEGSWSAIPPTPQSRFQNLSAASRFLFELNRQTSELETALSLRKQTTANYSNRQKNSFLATGHSLLATLISNRELLGLEILQITENKGQRPALIANFEPNDSLAFLAGGSK
jgi:hypothetical protein